MITKKKSRKELQYLRDEALQSYLNRPDFQYDANGDALYRHYKDQYTQLGKTAMQDTMGQAAALTGGYGSSYAQNVGQQAYQSYLSKADDVIPELYQLAYDRYRDKGDRLYKSYQSWSQLEQQAAQQEQWEREYELEERKRQDANRRFELEQEQENSQTQTGTYQPDHWAMIAHYQKLGQNNQSKETAAEPEYDNGKVSEGNVKTMQRVLGLEETGKWTDEDRTVAGGLTADKAWEYYQKGQLQNYKSVGLGFDIGNIKTMERVLGLEEDGYWSKEDQKAAGGLTAHAAWKDYQQGKLQSRSKSGMTVDEWSEFKKKQSQSSGFNMKETTRAVREFIGQMMTKEQASKRGITSKEWEAMVVDRLNHVQLSAAEFNQLEMYYGLNVAGGKANTTGTDETSAQKMSYTEYREKAAPQKIDDLNAEVQRYFRDYQAFANSAVYDLQNAGYQNATAMLESHIQTANELRKWADTLLTSLETSGDIISGDYSELLDLISSTREGVDSIMEALGDNVKYYSTWDTEEAYDAYLTTQKQLAEDPDKLNREIAVLENMYTVYEDLVTREISEAEEAKLARLRQQYPSLGDLKAAIKEKKQHLETVTQCQDQAKQNAQRAKEYHDTWGRYLEADDFEYYSTLGAAIKNPTMDTAESGGRFLWWEWDGDDIGNIVTYSRENADILATAYANGQETKGHYKYRSMRDEEVDIYNYLLAKEGQEKANEFLSFLDDELNAREGGGLAERITGIDVPVIEQVATGLYGLGVGVDQWASGVRQLFTNEQLPTTVEQYANSAIADSLTGVGKYAYTGANVIGNMAPSILLSYVTAGAGAPAAVAQGVGAAAVGMSAAGNAYGSALRDGYSIGQARAYSTLVGAAEGTLQYILGGISSLGGVTDDLIKAKINMIDNSLLRISAKLGVDVFSEVTEEELQNFLEPAFRSIIFGEEYDAPTIDEMLETAIVTAGTTLLLGGGDTVSGDLAANRLLNATAQMANDQTNTPYNQEDIAKRLLNKGFNPKKSADMAEVIAARLNGQKLTKTQTGRLRAAMENAVVRDVMYDITKEKAEGIDSTQNKGYDETGGNKNGNETVTEGSSNNPGRNAFSEDSYESGSDIPNHLKPQNLMDELASSGVKYNPDEVIAVIKTPDGHLLWLEQGNTRSGLTHILERHTADFASHDVDDIPQLLSDVVKNTPIKTGSNSKGLFADYVSNGNTYRVAFGTNGYVVSFYPID